MTLYDGYITLGP